MIFIRGLISLSVVLAISCAGKSPKSSKDKLNVGAPGKYQANNRKGRPVADTHWIRSFGDAKLNELVELAEKNNRDIAVAAANMNIAAARARESGSNLYPQVQGLFNGRRSKQNFIGFPIAGPAGGSSGPSSSQFNEFGVSLDMSWELDLWGRIRAGQSASIAEMEASIADRASTRLSIGAQTAKAWFALIEARQQRDLAKRTIEIFGHTEKTLRNQLELGIADGQKGLASQLRLAMSDRATASESLLRREQDVEQISRQLEVLLGEYPHGKMNSGIVLPKMPPTPPAGIPASLLDRRPDLVAAERRLAATDKRLLEAKLNMLPAISLTGATGSSSGDLENLLADTTNVWRFAGQAAQPIFQGGRIRAGINIVKAEGDKALASFEQSALTAFQEVEDALAAERFLQQREQALEEAARLAKDAFTKADEDYANGVGDVLTTLTSQRQMVIRKSDSLLISRLRLDNRINLHLALGGDFKERSRE